MATLDTKHYDYTKMMHFGPLTEFKDIEVGATYHIPPIIIYDRRDFIVERKDYNTVTGQMRHADGKWEKQVLYQSELSIRFMVKIDSIKKN